MQYTIGNWTYDKSLGELSNGDKVLKPRLKVLMLLETLVAQQGSLVTRDELIASIWDGNHLTGDKALNSVVYALRTILNEGAKGPNAIQTVPKRGYILTAPVANTPKVVQLQMRLKKAFEEHLLATRAALLAGVMVATAVSAVSFPTEVQATTSATKVVSASK